MFKFLKKLQPSLPVATLIVLLFSNLLAHVSFGINVGAPCGYYRYRPCYYDYYYGWNAPAVYCDDSRYACGLLTGAMVASSYARPYSVADEIAWRQESRANAKLSQIRRLDKKKHNLSRQSEKRIKSLEKRISQAEKKMEALENEKNIARKVKKNPAYKLETDPQYKLQTDKVVDLEKQVKSELSNLKAQSKNIDEQIKALEKEAQEILGNKVKDKSDE